MVILNYSRSPIKIKEGYGASSLEDIEIIRAKLRPNRLYARARLKGAGLADVNYYGSFNSNGTGIFRSFSVRLDRGGGALTGRGFNVDLSQLAGQTSFRSRDYLRGDDTIIGAKRHNNKIKAWEGSDLIVGGNMYNDLAGGTGRDVFRVSPFARTFIRDFRTGEDLLDLPGSTKEYESEIRKGTTYLFIRKAQDPFLALAGAPDLSLPVVI